MLNQYYGDYITVAVFVAMGAILVAGAIAANMCATVVFPFVPVIPVSAAGWRIEPPVSVPVAAATRRADTAAVEPPEEPPGTRLKSQGLEVVKKAEFSVEEPMANSSILALAMSTAPTCFNLVTTVAS